MTAADVSGAVGSRKDYNPQQESNQCRSYGQWSVVQLQWCCGRKKIPEVLVLVYSGLTTRPALLSALGECFFNCVCVCVYEWVSEWVCVWLNERKSELENTEGHEHSGACNPPVPCLYRLPVCTTNLTTNFTNLLVKLTTIHGMIHSTNLTCALLLAKPLQPTY